MRLDQGKVCVGGIHAGCMRGRPTKGQGKRQTETPPRSPDLAPLGQKDKVVNAGMREQGKGI